MVAFEKASNNVSYRTAFVPKGLKIFILIIFRNASMRTVDHPVRILMDKESTNL